VLRKRLYDSGVRGKMVESRVLSRRTLIACWKFACSGRRLHCGVTIGNARRHKLARTFLALMSNTVVDRSVLHCRDNYTLLLHSLAVAGATPAHKELPALTAKESSSSKRKFDPC